MALTPTDRFLRHVAAQVTQFLWVAEKSGVQRPGKLPFFPPLRRGVEGAPHPTPFFLTN